jgi:adenosylhomocysteine nucleosidase
MARIALICAMPMELKPLVRKLSLRKTEVGGVSLHSGNLGDHEVVAIATGMGTKLAAAATEQLLNAVDVERVVVFGITGAVENDTPIGTLILPEVVVNSITGSEHRPAPLGGGTPHGKMWTTDLINSDLEEIARLREQGVVSLDMETAVIAESCERHAIPWSVFRVISDRSTDGTVTEETFRLANQDGTPNVPAILRYFLKHPNRIPKMMKVGQGAVLATKNAADAAIRAVSAA